VSQQYALGMIYRYPPPPPHTHTTTTPPSIDKSMYPRTESTQDEYRSEPGSVIAADFYHASTLLPLSDEEIVRKVHANIAKCEPGFKDAKVG
jgi:hypothetical protein